MTGPATTRRVYLPDVFITDARECNPDIEALWDRIEALPQSRRGGGTGRWADLSPAEAEDIRAEAVYRAEYWLTGKFGVKDIQPYERTAGLAARRVAEALS